MPRASKTQFSPPLAITFKVIFVFLVLLVTPITVKSQLDATFLKHLAEKWAPLIWLAPLENYFPLAVEEFLFHVYPVNAEGRLVSPTLPIGRSSETVYLVTRKNFDSLINTTSFLNGRDPRKRPIPVYVIVSECPTATQTEHSNELEILPQPKSKGNNNTKTLFQLTYWMFYPYNEGKDFCFFGRIPVPYLFNTCLGNVKTLGNHIGDFERVTLTFGTDYEPDEMFLSVHDIGVYYKYDPSSKIFVYSKELSRPAVIQRVKFPRVVRTFEGRPVLYSAKGSHGLWSAPGDFSYLRVPKLYDQSGHGIPWQTWKKVKVYRLGYDKLPAWMKYMGRWGTMKKNCFLFQKLGICEVSDGPFGILRNKQDFYCE